MSKFKIPNLNSLVDKVVVITGGALGIGAELVRLCYQHKAHVFFGDVLEAEGRALVIDLMSAEDDSHHIQFIKVDVSSYEDNVKLFDAAYTTCGHVDHAVSAAGIGEKGKIVDSEMTLEDVRTLPSTVMSPLDINLTAAVFFSRIASVYLRQGLTKNDEVEGPESPDGSHDGASKTRDAAPSDYDDTAHETVSQSEDASTATDTETTGTKRSAPSEDVEVPAGSKRPRGRPRKYPKSDKPKGPIGRPRESVSIAPSIPPRPVLSITKSLTLVSSVAGFTEAPGLTVYSTAKHGVLGLMRSLRKMLIRHTPSQGHKIRTNAICPWMTKTRMVLGVQDDWAKARLPTNEPIDVARAIAGTMVDRSLNGAALYVAGGEAYDIEPGLERTMPSWMGKRLAEQFNIGQTVLGTGEDWQKGKKRAKDLNEVVHRPADDGDLSTSFQQSTELVAKWHEEDRKDPAAVGKFKTSLG